MRKLMLIASVLILLTLAAWFTLSRERAQLGPAIKTGDAVTGSPDVVSLEQGWTAATRSWLYSASFGSRLMPYAWITALEQASSDKRWLESTNVEALGLLPQQAAAHNPDALPVGFTRDVDEQGDAWVGLGCAACHVGELHFSGTRMRIDGGPAMLNFTAFEQSLLDALDATVKQPQKFARFAQALGQSPDVNGPLGTQLEKIQENLNTRHQMNQTPVPYGFGRLDAFGQIFNAATVTFTDQPGNGQPPDAPVSFPMLWSAPHLDLVQWNGSAPNTAPGPLIQNVTTAIAVYGSVELDVPASGLASARGYRSSVNFDNLGKIQNDLFELTAPAWPEDILGAIDRQAATRGGALYDSLCQGCHERIDRADPKRKLRAVLTPVEEIGTDPKAAANFINATAATGRLQGEHQAVVAGERFGESSRAILMVVNLALGATLRHPAEALHATLTGYHGVLKAKLDDRPNFYKARALDGIWASPPYLHNGSVPSLYELLLPAEQRSKRFYVGSREYQPKFLGLETDKSFYSSLFDTALPGNSNSGHEYGAELTEAQRMDLLEHLKTL
ncbi:MAG: di-heme-cytochrome C peroxidase [Pseudomonadota bacterium]